MGAGVTAKAERPDAADAQTGACEEGLAHEARIRVARCVLLAAASGPTRLVPGHGRGRPPVEPAGGGLAAVTAAVAAAVADVAAFCRAGRETQPRRLCDAQACRHTMLTGNGFLLRCDCFVVAPATGRVAAAAARTTAAT